MVNARMLSRFVAAVFVVGLLVAGCSDADGEPTPTAGPTVTESASESPSSPEPTSAAPRPTPWPEPTRPAAMERDDLEGAKAAAEYFLSLFAYVHVTGELAAWNAMSHPECDFCNSVAKDVSDLYASGGSANGPVLEITAVQAAPPDDEYEFFSVWIDANESASSRYDSDGVVVEHFEASRLEADMALARTNGDWVVRGVVGRSPEDGGSDA